MLKPSEKEFTEHIENLGTFTFKFPTLSDEVRADNITARMLGDNKNPSISAMNIATMTGMLTVGIVKSPAGFDINEVYSYEELEAVYNVYTEKVSSFRGQSKFAKQPGIKDAVPEDGQGTPLLVSE